VLDVYVYSLLPKTSLYLLDLFQLLLSFFLRTMIMQNGRKISSSGGDLAK